MCVEKVFGGREEEDGGRECRRKDEGMRVCVGGMMMWEGVREEG